MNSGKIQFDPHSSRQCTVLLLVLIAVFCVSSELGARFAFPRISRVRGRIEMEAHQARMLSGGANHPAVLLVGNSLVERGVNVPALQQDLPEYQVRRFVVSDTSYVDWYYGLRKLFEEGSRPQIVVLGLSTRNFALVRFEGDLSANLLLRTRDVSSVGKILHDSNTELSNLYAANLSSFFGSRTQVRKWLLTAILPDVDTLASRLRGAPTAAPAPAQIQEISQKRLEDLKALCAGYGASFVLVIPPSLNHNEPEIEAVEAAGTAAGVPVLSPIDPGQLGADSFRDGLHLTDEGALVFTAKLSSALRRTLPTFLRASLY